MAKFLADSLLSPHKQRPLSGEGKTQLQGVNVQTLWHQILELSAITCSPLGGEYRVLFLEPQQEIRIGLWTAGSNRSIHAN